MCVVEMDAGEIKNENGGTEIGYWIGYYGEKTLEFIGNAFENIGTAAF